MELKEHRLTKFGVSEHKRRDYIFFYYQSASSFSELEGTDIKNVNLIYKKLLKKGVYLRKKKKINISRELTFFKNKFPLYELRNEKIYPTILTKNILKNYDKKIFFGKTYLENAIILFLIKQYKTKEIDNHPFYYSLKLAKQENLRKKEWIDKILLMNKKDLLKKLTKESDFLDLINFFHIGSGIPNVKKYKQLQNFQNDANKLVEQIIKNIFSKNKDEIKIIDSLYILINDFLNLRKEGLLKNFPKGLISLFEFRGNTGIYLFIKNYQNNNLDKYIDLIKNIDIERLYDKFYVKNKYNDYSSLIQRYLFLTNFFIIEYGNVKLNSKYDSYINQLINKYQVIKEMDWKDKNIIDELNKLEISEDINKNYDFSIREIINNYYTNDFYANLFSKINQSKNINKTLLDISKENEHINGIVDNPPTIYEFFINLFFFKIFYRKELENTFLISDEKITNKFKKSIRTNLSSNLVPLRFAAGHNSDAIFYDYNVLIEPTLVEKDQVKHELQSIIKHLKKNKYNIAIMVAPTIEDMFYPSAIAYKKYQYGYLILPFDNNILIKLNDSKDSLKLFNQIKDKSWKIKEYNLLNSFLNDLKI